MLASIHAGRSITPTVAGSTDRAGRRSIWSSSFGTMYETSARRLWRDRHGDQRCAAICSLRQSIGDSAATAAVTSLFRFGGHCVAVTFFW